uniref:NYN domain-containing protein n=1 Tax=Noccaea caerulescens TaxID=107243 RepID=A0A1J3K442_NOCCA
MMMNKATQEFAGAVTAVFWNIDTCPIPRGVDARRVGPCMKRYLEKLGYTGPLTMNVFGTLIDTPAEHLEAVSSTGFLLRIDPYGSKSLTAYMFRWANKQNPPPANIMVITNSRYAAIPLCKLQGEGYNVITPYPLGPASRTRAWKRFLRAESKALDKDYPIETVESSWVCQVCYGLTGRGFDNFTTHISSQGHADKELDWITPAAPLKRRKPMTKADEETDEETTEEETDHKFRPRRLSHSHLKKAMFASPSWEPGEKKRPRA